MLDLWPLAVGTATQVWDVIVWAAKLAWANPLPTIALFVLAVLGEEGTRRTSRRRRRRRRGK